MKRKLAAVLMVMTLALSCGMVAVADEPLEEGTEMSQAGDDGGEGEEQEGKEEEKESMVPETSADTSMNENVISEDKLRELQENVVEKQNPTVDGENAIEEEIPVDETHFSDAAFREYINEEVDKDQNGSLSKDEIEDIKSIFLGDNIKNLKGIEYLTNLEFFVFNGLSLESLDLSKNTKIKEGVLGHCQITNLVFNSELVGLGYYYSQITNLDVSNLKLKMLWCKGNLLHDLVSIPTLEYIKLYDDMHLPYLDLSIQKNMRTGDGGEYGEYGDSGTPGHHNPMGGAYLAPQTISRTVTSVNGVWTLNMTSIVGKDYLDRVTLVTEGAEMSKDGLVTFSGSEIPTELTYNFDTKNPAKTTLMEVTVVLSGVKDQTKEEVSIDTSGLDLDRICREHNIDPSKAEIVLSQETPAQKDTEKLTQKVNANGYSFVNAYEIFMSLYSDGNKVADITENFGKLILTLQAGKDYAGYNAVVYQLHNGEEIISHEGLTVDAEGMVTISVDKFSTFAVAVKNNSSVNNPEQKPDNIQTSTNTPNNSTPTFSPSGNNTTNVRSVKTGDSLEVVLWSLLCIMSVSVVVLLARKKYYKHS